MADISIKNLCKDYYGVMCVFDLNLEVKDKTIAVIFGGVGSGKTTALKLICGLEKKSSGEILFDNTAAEVKLKRRDCAFVFSKPLLFNFKSVYDNLAYGLILRRESKEKINSLINNALALINSEYLLKKKKWELTFDEKQLICFIRAIIRKPDILLLDEPFFGIEFLEKFEKLQSYFSQTCIYATKKLDFAKRLNCHTVFLRDGQVLEQNAFTDIALHPKNIETAKLLQFNFFNSKIENSIAFEKESEQKFAINPENMSFKDKFKNKLICRFIYSDNELNKSICETFNQGFIVNDSAEYKSGEIINVYYT